MTPISKTLIGIFLDTVERHDKPDQFMRKGPAGWEKIPAHQALADVEALAMGLRELGVGRGDHVSLLSENRYEWPITDLAILGLGAVTVPLYPTLTGEQCQYILEDSDSKLLIVSSAEQLEKMRGCLALSQVRAILCLDQTEAQHEKVMSFATVMARGAEIRARMPNAFRESAAAVAPDDLATIIYTSGTTGTPKGVMLSHYNIASNVAASLQVMPLESTALCLSFLPLCHIFERMAGLYSMFGAGASIAYAQSIDTVGADAVEVRPTCLMGVPRFYEKIHARVMATRATMSGIKRMIFDWGLSQLHARARAHLAGTPKDSFAMRLADRLVASKIRERVGGRLEFCISGGAPLNPTSMEFFFAIGIPVLEGYGLTETSPVMCLNPPGKEKLGKVGPPIPGVEIAIGAEGEILTRGPNVMRGYYKNDEATAKAMEGGWFHTGDIGRIDDDGYLVITDRLKELIVTAGGKNVAPQPIEAKMKESKWVAEAVLIGDRKPFIACLIVPDFDKLEAEARAKRWNFNNRAELVARPEVRALYQAEVDRANDGLAHYETIKQFAILDRVLSQETGELTPKLSLKRRVIDQKFREVISEIYARKHEAEQEAAGKSR